MIGARVAILAILVVFGSAACDAGRVATTSPGRGGAPTASEGADGPTPTFVPISPTPPANPTSIGLPNRAMTPGATNPAVTESTRFQTICATGWSSKVRPPESYTEPLKIRQIGAYGYADRKVGDYEEDHLIPISLGGALRDPRNLWPEPHHVRLADGTNVGSIAKDGLEVYLRRAVCDGRLNLATAQHEIATNWIATWQAAGRP